MGSVSSENAWTKESIVFAIRKWTIQYGEPPMAKVWASPRRDRSYPSTFIVRDRFGTFNNGIRAAGFIPRERGVVGHIDPEWTVERFVEAARTRANGTI